MASESAITVVVGAVLPPDVEGAEPVEVPRIGHSAFQWPRCPQRRHELFMIRSWSDRFGRLSHELLPLPFPNPLLNDPFPLPAFGKGRAGKKPRFLKRSCSR